MKYEVVIQQCLHGIVYEHYEVNAANEEEARQKAIDFDGKFINESPIEVIGYYDSKVVETKKLNNYGCK